MNNTIKEKADVIYTVIIGVILAISVGITTWLSQIVITHGNMLASQAAKIEVNTSRLDSLENKGSPAFGAHVLMDDKRNEDRDKRTERLENAVLILQSAPGELKAISARLDSLKEGQNRIEKSMEDHMKLSK